MKKKPEIRAISSTVWSIEPNDGELPNVVVMAVPGRLQIRLDGLDSEEVDAEALAKDTLNVIVAKEFIKFAERLKNLDFNKE